jgi:superfamily I DNA/RNA helicase
MSTWLVPRSELTPEQVRAVELSPSEHRVILGGPGSGKTQILLHRARHLADHFRVGPTRFRVLVYTNVLKHYIESALPLLDLPPDTVVTFDDWCLNWHKANIPGRTPWDKEEKRPDFPAIRQAVMQKLARTREPLFDFVLVDEAQDLESEVFALLRSVARHITVCMDHKQQIYDGRSSEAMVLESLGIRKRNINLLEGYRCSPYLVRVAAELIADPEEREGFTNQARIAPRQKETPLIYYAKDGDDEMRRLEEIIRERQLVGDRIAILFPTQRKLYGFAKGLRERGIELETQRELDFGTAKPKLITYYSAKGLTFDTVLMPRLVADSAWKFMETRVTKLLFVGITRATRWAYLSTEQSKELPTMQRLKALVQRGDITEQRAASIVTSQSSVSPPARPDNLSFL